jgi:hypothetical protein
MESSKRTRVVLLAPEKRALRNCYEELNNEDKVQISQNGEIEIDN